MRHVHVGHDVRFSRSESTVWIGAQHDGGLTAQQPLLFVSDGSHL